jgi:hypothetical protein
VGHQRRVNFRLVEGNYSVVCKFGGYGSIYLSFAITVSEPVLHV